MGASFRATSIGSRCRAIRSPARDGRVFYVLATLDEPADETRTAIYAVRAGETPERFTSGTSDRMPRPAPDGTRLAFVSERGEGKRVYVASLAGGEAQPVSPAYDAIVALAWSHDARTLAFVATAPHDAAQARIALDERSGARHIRGLPFKSDDDGLLDGRRRHLFTLEPGGEPVQITSGDFDVHGPAWSPDGAQLAFSAQIGVPEASFLEDVYIVSREGGAPAKVTDSRGAAHWPVFSHDGRQIAYLGHERGDDSGGRFNTELFVRPLSGGAARSLSATVDRSMADDILCDTRGGAYQAPVWSGDDAEIFVSRSSEGTCAIAAFAYATGAQRIVAGGERDIFAFSLARDGGFAFAFSSPTVPAEIATLEGAGAERVLTDCNAWLAERSLRVPRRVRPHAADGTELDLWLLDAEPNREGAAGGPYVLQVHGGPHAAYGFAFMFEFQMLAAHGIGVGFGNPRGSQSYGEAYADAITGDWGGIDVDDVFALLDGMLANAPVDVTRVGLAGGSYGGFMTTTVLGRSDRFAAGVSMRAVNDFVSEVGASDLGWFLERETAAPWTDAGAKLFALSPMRTAHRIDVPLLVEHSERDYRCAIDQGEQLFTLLRRLGRKQTEFVRFVGDGHGLSRNGKPRNRVLRLRAIAHWFVRHLRPAAIEAVPENAGALFAPLSTENEAAQLPVP